MASPNTIDIDSLIQPISDEQPQGEDIREDRSAGSDYYTIKDARNSARAAERANMFDEDSSSETLALWKPVFDIAPQILKEKSKDLEVLSWYIEALVRLKGFAGLRDGIVLTKTIVENFWENLYPEPDEDGMETKVGPLTGLNGDGGEGTLLTPIRNASITTEGNQGEFSYWQYQQAHDASKISDEDKRSERFDALGFTLDAIVATVNAGSDQFYLNLTEDIQEAIDEYKALNELLREHCGYDAPPSSNISNLLDECLRAVRFLAKDKLARLAPEPEVALEEGDDSTAAQAAPQAVGTQSVAGVMAPVGPITGREDALARLQEVANFFRTYEPHTPLAAAIDRAVKWGRMSVSELMIELVPDATARAVYTQLTGVRLDGTADDSYVPPPVTAAPPPAEDSFAAPAPEAAAESTESGETEEFGW